MAHHPARTYGSASRLARRLQFAHCPNGWSVSPEPAQRGDEVQSTTSGVWAPRFLGLLRIVAGLLFMEHGMAKLLGWPHDPRLDTLHAFQLLWFAGIIELVGGGLLTIGLFTRCAAFVMSGEMAIAYFTRHAPNSFFPVLNGGDAAILFCFLFFYFFLAGGGSYSIDRVRA
jgi:putative oxidoreductase